MYNLYRVCSPQTGPDHTVRPGPSVTKCMMVKPLTLQVQYGAMGLDCDICSGRADSVFKRTEVWSNERLRLTTTTYRDIPGFSYLEPRWHTQYITDLDRLECAEFGKILAEVSSATKVVTGASLIYVYLYGDHIPHLHVHLAPHVPGDQYSDDVVKADLPITEDSVPESELFEFSRRVRKRLENTC